MSNLPLPPEYYEIDTTKRKYGLRKLNPNDKYTKQTQIWWPQADTGKLRDAAKAWNGLGSNLDYVADQLDRQVEFLTTSWSGEAQVGFTEMWTQWTSPIPITFPANPSPGSGNGPPQGPVVQKGHLRETADNCRGLGQLLSGYADEVDQYRQKLAAIIAATAVGIVVGVGLTVVTAGASDAAAAEAGAGLSVAASNLGIEMSTETALLLGRLSVTATYGFLGGLIGDVAGHITYNEVLHPLSDPLAGVTVQEMVLAGVAGAASATLFKALSLGASSEGLPEPPNPDEGAPPDPFPKLDPGRSYDMYQQARSLCLAAPPSQRADMFADFVKQITEASGGQWSAQEFAGTNGERIFEGEYGEAMVIDKDGNMFRGKAPEDFTYHPETGQEEPNYQNLRRLP